MGHERAHAAAFLSGGPARWAIGVGLIMVALLVAGRLVVEPSAPATAVVVEGTAAPGQPAPRVELPDFQGRPVRLADFRGRPVILNFWASWCPACIAEMPAFERLHRRLGDRVVFLGVNQRDDRRAALDLARRTSVTYRLAVDDAGRSFDAFVAWGCPPRCSSGPTAESPRWSPASSTRPCWPSGSAAT